MTIIKPKQYKQYIGALAVLFIPMVLGGMCYIYQYNVLADYRHQLTSVKEQIAEAQVANAELKNDLYVAIDPTQLESLADAHHLVLERNPDYLNVNKWVSDSSY